MHIAKENRSDLAEMFVCFVVSVVCVLCAYVTCYIVLYIISISTRKSISAQQLISPSNTKELMKETLRIIGF